VRGVEEEVEVKGEGRWETVINQEIDFDPVDCEVCFLQNDLQVGPKSTRE